MMLTFVPAVVCEIAPLMSRRAVSPPEPTLIFKSLLSCTGALMMSTPTVVEFDCTLLR